MVTITVVNLGGEVIEKDVGCCSRVIYLFVPRCSPVAGIVDE